MNLVMPVLAGLLFLYCGFFLERAGPDGFAGIRTPGTLEQPGGREEDPRARREIIQDCRYRELGGALVPDLAVWFILVPVITGAPATVACSYYAFRQEQEKS